MAIVDKPRGPAGSCGDIAGTCGVPLSCRQSDDHRLPQLAANCHRLSQMIADCRRPPQITTNCRSLPQLPATHRSSPQSHRSSPQLTTDVKSATNGVSRCKLVEISSTERVLSTCQHCESLSCVIQGQTAAFGPNLYPWCVEEHAPYWPFDT